VLSPDEVPAPTLSVALANLAAYRAQLVDVIRDQGDAARSDADVDVGVATCRLAVGFTHGAIACAIALAKEGADRQEVDGEGTDVDVGASLIACLRGMFILCGIVQHAASQEEGDKGEEDKEGIPLSQERMAVITFIHEVVLASVFPLDHSLTPIVEHARKLLRGLTPSDVRSAETTVDALKHLADCIGDLAFLPRWEQTKDGSIRTEDTVYRAVFALEFRAVAAELAVSLMTYQTRHAEDERTVKWLEDAQRFVLDAVDGAASILQDNGNQDLLLKPLDQADWFPQNNVEDDEGSEDESQASSDDEWDAESVPPDSDNEDAVDPADVDANPTGSLLGAINILIDRFIEADEGFRRQYPDLALTPDGARIDTGRHKAVRKYKGLLHALFTHMRAGKLAVVNKSDAETRKAALRRIKKTIKDGALATLPKGASKEQRARVFRAVDNYPHVAAAAASAATLLIAAVESGKPITIQAAAKPRRGKRKSEASDETDAGVARKAATETERELREHGVPQSMLDEVLRPPSKKPRLSGDRASTPRGSTSRGTPKGTPRGTSVSAASRRISSVAAHRISSDSYRYSREPSYMPQDDD
jgi:hypothetical protein